MEQKSQCSVILKKSDLCTCLACLFFVYLKGADFFCSKWVSDFHCKHAKLGKLLAAFVETF